MQLKEGVNIDTKPTSFPKEDGCPLTTGSGRGGLEPISGLLHAASLCEIIGLRRKSVSLLRPHYFSNLRTRESADRGDVASVLSRCARGVLGVRFSGMGVFVGKASWLPTSVTPASPTSSASSSGNALEAGCAAAGRRVRGSRATAHGVRGREGRPYDYVLSPYHHTLAVTPQPCGRHSG